MSDLNSERRRRPRISTMMLCEVRDGVANPRVVRIRDLSELGVKIATKSPLSVGERVWIRLPGMKEWLLARVAWQNANLFGLAFSRAIELPHIARERRPSTYPYSLAHSEATASA